MEWFHHFIENIFQGIFWRTLLARFQWVDWFTMAFGLIGMIYGMRRGLMREIIEILELVIIIFLIFTYSPTTTALFDTYLPQMTHRAIQPLGFILTTAFFWFAIAFIDGYLRKAVHAKMTGLVRTAGGALFGALHFIIIWSVISQALILMPMPYLTKLYEPGNSVSGEKIKNLAPKIHDMLTNPKEYMPVPKVS